jgi:hypothetical protein
MTLFAFLAAAAFPTIATAQEGEREFERELVEGDWMYHVLDPDAIPAVDHPEFATRDEAEAFMADAEPVLGLVVNGEARAYSLFHLDHHEIVNDSVGGRKVAVTW